MSWLSSIGDLFSSKPGTQAARTAYKDVTRGLEQGYGLGTSAIQGGLKQETGSFADAKIGRAHV